MQATKLFLIIAAVYVCGFFAHAYLLGKTVYGDGAYYYSWLHSAVVDRDIDFTNEYAYLHAAQPVTPLGLQGNKYSIGPALLWFPFYYWTHLVLRGNGYGLPYQLAVGLAGVLYALTGIVLLYRTLLSFYSPKIALYATVCTAFATNLLFYGSVDTVNSHALSFFACTLFISVLFQKTRNWALIGTVLGLVALIRPQDTVIALLAVPYLSALSLAALILAAFAVFAPQLAAWHALNGTLFTSPYLSSIEGFRYTSPQIAGVLFSPQSGIFLWTPAVPLGFVGLWRKKQSLPLFLMALVFVIQIYIVSAWSIWWQGASFSGRMFSGMLPIVAFGLAHLFETITRRILRTEILLYAITIPLSVINALLIGYFLLSH